MRQRPFRQVDVFTDVPYHGNPVAVVLDAEGIGDESLARFARWTNLSETTFVLPPDDPEADYRLRIFTPYGELPFAGHPTLGSCHAWLDAGGAPRDGGRVVQECGVGLVEIRLDAGRPAFAAPPRRRTGPLHDELLDRIARGVGIAPDAIEAHAWVDNGPGWCAVLLRSAAEVLALRADFGVLGDVKLGVVGPHDGDPPLGRDVADAASSRPHGADAAPHGSGGGGTGGDGSGRTGSAAGAAAPAFELRAFFPGTPDAEGRVTAGFEDPVTGSLNASVAQWLREEGRAPERYLAAQGTAIGRAGRVHVEDDGERIWVGGDCVVGVTGSVLL